MCFKKIKLKIYLFYHAFETLLSIFSNTIHHTFSLQKSEFLYSFASTLHILHVYKFILFPHVRISSVNRKIPDS